MFSPLASDHANNPRHAGEMPDATHYGQCGIPGEGPYVQIWLKVDDGSVIAASQQTNGCPGQMASASLTAELITGRTIEEVLRIEPRDIETILGGLPEGKGHCPEMAIMALRSALLDDLNEGGKL